MCGIAGTKNVSQGVVGAETGKIRILGAKVTASFLPAAHSRGALAYPPTPIAMSGLIRG